jgi:hypothetical protein
MEHWHNLRRAEKQAGWLARRRMERLGYQSAKS